MFIGILTQSGNYGNNGNYNRQTSFDRVRKIIQEEGREARNLVQYNVPVEDEQHQHQSKLFIFFMYLYSIDIFLDTFALIVPRSGKHLDTHIACR